METITYQQLIKDIIENYAHKHPQDNDQKLQIGDGRLEIE